MFRRILVPTDVSEPSRHALATALGLARQFGSEVVLLHVSYTPQAYLSYTASYGIVIPQENLEAVGEAALEAALTGADLTGVSLKKKHVPGYPAGVILEQIKDEKIDLVVMGSHGHGPFTGAVIGSVSQRVLAHAPCPVLIVK